KRCVFASPLSASFHAAPSPAGPPPRTAIFGTRSVIAASPRASSMLGFLILLQSAQTDRLHNDAGQSARVKDRLPDQRCGDDRRRCMTHRRHEACDARLAHAKTAEADWQYGDEFCQRPSENPLSYGCSRANVLRDHRIENGKGELDRKRQRNAKEKRAAPIGESFNRLCDIADD